MRVTGVQHSHIITFFLQSVLILDGLSSFVQPSCGDLLSRGVEILYDIFIFYFFKNYSSVYVYRDLYIASDTQEEKKMETPSLLAVIASGNHGRCFVAFIR